MAKDYKNPLEARVTKPEPLGVTQGQGLPGYQDLSGQGSPDSGSASSPSGELADKLRAKIKTQWDKVTIDDNEILDPTKLFKDIDWAIEINGIKVFAFDDYNYLQGQAGHGKSFTMSIYESVILGQPFGTIRYIGNRPQPKVLHIDTEQSEGNVQLHKARVYNMVGWEQTSDHRDQYQIMMLRSTPSPEQRWAKVIRKCYEFQPDFIFLDGMLDVVVGMNKEEECNILISEAGALAEMLHLCMVAICHENPDNAKKEEGPAKPAGHIGSFSQRKGSAGQGTKKLLSGVTPTFNVAPKKVRNKDYVGFAFGIRDTEVLIGDKTYNVGIPYWIDTNNPLGGGNDGQDEETKAVREAVQSIQWKSIGLSYTELEGGLKHYGITSNRKLSDYITMAQQKGIIEKRDKRYFLLETGGASVDTQQGMKVDENDPQDPF